MSQENPLYMCRICVNSVSEEEFISVLDKTKICPLKNYVEVIEECAAHNVS